MTKYPLLPRTKPKTLVAISKDLHEAIKAYASSRGLPLREATEHLLKNGLYIEYSKRASKDNEDSFAPLTNPPTAEEICQGPEGGEVGRF